MRLLLVRHAQRIHEPDPEDPRLIGRTDVPLSAEGGDEQALMLARRRTATGTSWP